MTYRQFDVILVHFPFAERKGKKQRPAVVLTRSEFNSAHEHSFVAMITTAFNTRWPSDLAISHYAEAGLRAPCVVRAKFFTVSHEVVIGRVGTLSGSDRVAVRDWLADITSVAHDW